VYIFFRTAKSQTFVKSPATPTKPSDVALIGILQTTGRVPFSNATYILYNNVFFTRKTCDFLNGRRELSLVGRHYHPTCEYGQWCQCYWTHAACLDFGIARVLVEVPDVAVVAERKPVPHNPLVLSSVAAPFGHHASYQRRRTQVDLKPLIRCNHRSYAKSSGTSYMESLNH